MTDVVEAVLALGEGEFARLLAQIGVESAVLPSAASPLAVRQQAFLDWCRNRPEAAERVAVLLRLRGEGRGGGLYRVPPGSPHFVGREEDLGALLAMLDGGNALVRAAMEGLPGVGKTELAIQLARQASREGRFPGGICWLNAENPDLTLEWDRIGEEMGQPGTPGVERAQATLAAVRRTREPVLLVLDNVTKWSQKEQPAPLPVGDHVRLLVTTRQGELGGTSFRHHRLRFLPREAAAALLRDVAGREIPGVEPLLTHLDGHALAVELAGAFLRAYPDVSPREYLAELRAGDPSSSVAERTRYEATVEQALGSVWERLGEGVRRAWAVAACFEPEAVSVPLAEACGLDRELRRRLRELHLVEDAGEGRIRMHRLVRGFGLARGGVEERRAFVEGCLERVKGVDLQVGYRVLKDRAHLEALVGGGTGWLEASFEEQFRLLDRVGTVLHSAGLPGSARRHRELALANTLEHLGEDHPDVAASRSNLALVLQDLGDLQAARVLLEQTLASDLRNYPEDHPSVATSRSNLATVLQDFGDLPAARLLLNQALATALQTFGEDHPDVAIRRSNLAVVLRDLGELPAARGLLELALSRALRHLDEDHPTVALRRSNLAAVLQDLGELQPARALLEQALASDLRNFGEDHPNVANRRSHLATVLLDLGDLSTARVLLEQALASDLRNLGEHHPGVATTRSNLADMYRELGDFPAAAALGRQVVASESRLLGLNHPELGHSRMNLAFILRDLGDTSAAAEEAVEALRIARLQPEGSKVRTWIERSAPPFLLPPSK